MSLGEEQPAPGDRIFRAAVSADADPAAFAALMGVARQFPGVHIEEQRLDSSSVITGSDLDRGSDALWGDITYGRFAASYINGLRREATDQVVRRDDGRFSFAQGGYHAFDLPRREEGFPESLEDEALDGHLMALFDSSRLPFSMQIRHNAAVSARRRYDETLRHVQPNDLIKDRLAGYLEWNKLHEHTLHGALGKGFDVLLQSAGIARPDAPSREHDGAFVGKKQLHGMMSEAGISSSKQQSIVDALRQAVNRQLRNGKADEFGEVVIEKPIGVDGSSFMRVGWEQVAVLSVELSASRRKASPEVIDFLSTFTERYTAYSNQ